MIQALRRIFFAPKQTPGLAHGRPCRVVALIITIVLLSLADLYISLIYLHSGGMGEANPVARWIMGHGNASLLVVWKLLTVGLAAVILFSARRTRVGEFGAWMCMLMLTWLTIRWAHYADEVRNYTSEIHALTQYDEARWVTMTNEP